MHMPTTDHGATEHCTERMTDRLTEKVLETTGQINGVSKDDETERASLKSVRLSVHHPFVHPSDIGMYSVLELGLLSHPAVLLLEAFAPLGPCGVSHQICVRTPEYVRSTLRVSVCMYVCMYVHLGRQPGRHCSIQGV